MYKYSKGAMEEFFQDPRLNKLFEYFADEIKAKGHNFSENRGLEKKVDAEKQLKVMNQFIVEVDNLRSIANYFRHLKPTMTNVNITSKGIKKSVKETKRITM